LTRVLGREEGPRKTSLTEERRRGALGKIAIAMTEVDDSLTGKATIELVNQNGERKTVNPMMVMVVFFLLRDRINAFQKGPRPQNCLLPPPQLLELCRRRSCQKVGDPKELLLVGNKTDLPALLQGRNKIMCHMHLAASPPASERKHLDTELTPIAQIVRVKKRTKIMVESEQQRTGIRTSVRLHPAHLFPTPGPSKLARLPNVFASIENAI